MASFDSVRVKNAIVVRDLDTLKQLINADNVNYRSDATGTTALHLVCSLGKGDEACVRFLLQNKADINIATITTRMVPLQYAMLYCTEEQVRLIGGLLGCTLNQ